MKDECRTCAEQIPGSSAWWIVQFECHKGEVLSNAQHLPGVNTLESLKHEASRVGFAIYEPEFSRFGVG